MPSEGVEARFLAHRALLALRASSLLCSGDIFLKRLGPSFAQVLRRAKLPEDAPYFLFTQSRLAVRTGDVAVQSTQLFSFRVHIQDRYP